MTCSAVLDHMMPITLTGFMDHVQKMHAEYNKGFMTEYQVCVLCVCVCYLYMQVLYKRYLF